MPFARLASICLLSLAMLLLLPAADANAAEAPADFVLLGGRVHSLDERGTVAQAVAVRAEKIVYVGDDQGV